MTSTSDLDEQLREHYGSFRRDHAALRQRLLKQLRSPEQVGVPSRSEAKSTFFNRRLVMRLSAAAVVGLIVGIAYFLVNPGPQGMTWADVVKAIGPIESVQYSASEFVAPLNRGGPERRNTTRNYVTADAVRVDMWAGHDVDRGPDTSHGSTPTRTRITRAVGREVTTYVVENVNGQPSAIQQYVDYNGSAPELGDPRASDDDLRPAADVLKMWRRLQDLQPESVLKRGSQDVNGQHLLRFEVIDAVFIPGLSRFQSSAFILVDPKTRQPVKLESGTDAWTGIRFNETIPPEKFAAPTVPDDLDASVIWRFNLLAETWNAPGFTFRVLDPQGKPIVNQADVQIQPAPTGPGGGGGLFGAGGPPGQTVEGGVSLLGSLSREGVDRLDKFMARNPGAEMTIEITGEKPITRKVYGRLARDSEVRGQFGSAVYFKLPTRADAKAATRPSGTDEMEGQVGAAGGVSPGMPGGSLPGRPRAVRPRR